jgi:hypothetical protein
MAIDSALLRQDEEKEKVLVSPARDLNQALVWVPSDADNPFKAILRVPPRNAIIAFFEAAQDNGFTFKGYPIDLTWDSCIVPSDCDLPEGLQGLHQALCEALVCDHGTVTKTKTGWKSMGMHGIPKIGE